MLISNPAAIACILGHADGLTGTARFYAVRGGVLVEVGVDGLPESKTGFFALHIHEGEHCGGEPGPQGHWNPTGTVHPKHAGDLPPLLSCDGRAYMAVMTDRFQIDQIVGRTVVIHSSRDDFTTQPSGDPGEIIACGEIRRFYG